MQRSLLGQCLACWTLVACTNDTRVGEDTPGLVGRIVTEAGTTAPSGHIRVFWRLPDSDRYFMFGTGSVRGDRFVLPVDEPPPPDALNDGLGVGYLALVSNEFENGYLAREPYDFLGSDWRGSATEHAIIYRRSGATDSYPWQTNFPLDAYRCARHVPPVPDGDGSSFAPVDCADVTVNVGEPASLAFPQWD